MQLLASSVVVLEDVEVFTTMATPAVLLLANSMLILSTIQRLQAILSRVRENEESLPPRAGEGPAPGWDALREELEMHGRRVRLAHRALFAFYASAAALLVMVGALGAGALAWAPAVDVALVAAFAGAVLLLLGAALLMGETWVGVHATDRRVTRVVEMCEEKDLDEFHDATGPGHGP